jgi:hypothetical protein
LKSLRKSNPNINAWSSNASTNRSMLSNHSPTLNGVDWTIHVTDNIVDFNTLHVPFQFSSLRWRDFMTHLLKKLWVAQVSTKAAIINPLTVVSTK